MNSIWQDRYWVFEWISHFGDDQVNEQSIWCVIYTVLFYLTCWRLCWAVCITVNNISNATLGSITWVAEIDLEASNSVDDLEAIHRSIQCGQEPGWYLRVRYQIHVLKVWSPVSYDRCKDALWYSIGIIIFSIALGSSIWSTTEQ